MEKCTTGETAFKSSHPLRVSIRESAGDFLVYVHNQGKNIVFVRRILLHRQFSSGGYSIHYFRDDSANNYYIPGSRLEPGIMTLKLRLAKGSATSAQAQAEYYELPCRAVSCAYEV